MAKYVNITAQDTLLGTSKVTKGLFPGDVGVQAGSGLSTSSLSTTQTKYYHNLQVSDTDVMSVTYGHVAGSGSSGEQTNTFGETRAIYKQFMTTLQNYDDADPGDVNLANLIINDATESAFYAIVFERARMKDRVNRKNWTLTLSASLSHSVGKKIHLTDDSADSGSFVTPVGPRYNIVSGAAGVVNDATPFGYFYPDVGVLLLGEQRLSASLPGTPGYVLSGSPFAIDGHQNGTGFARNDASTADNAGKLVNVLANSTLTFRNEEDINEASYFCRATSQEFNFSSNPTFWSGSRHEFTNKSFEGNPTTFITTVGLYNSNDELVAVGRLSSPIEKNYSTEATIKVKLSY